MRTDKRSNETIPEYAARLKEKAEYWDYGDSTNKRILEHMVQTIDDDELITRMIQKEWILKEVSQRHDLQYKLKDILRDCHMTVNVIDKINTVKKDKKSKG